MIAERLKKARQKEEQLKIRAAALERTKVRQMCCVSCLLTIFTDCS